MMYWQNMTSKKSRKIGAITGVDFFMHDSMNINAKKMYIYTSQVGNYAV